MQHKNFPQRIPKK